MKGRSSKRSCPSAPYEVNQKLGTNRIPIHPGQKVNSRATSVLLAGHHRERVESLVRFRVLFLFYYDPSFLKRFK